MDLLDFEGQDLYFDEHPDARAAGLIDQAAARYGDGEAELPLLQAFLLAPEDLTVLVALYRFYYYQHRLDFALEVAQRVLRVTAYRLGFPLDWRELSMPLLGAGAMRSMGMVRFYLLALKAAGYLLLRLDQLEAGREMLCKVTELDTSDRLGAGALLDVANAVADVNARSGRVLAR